LFRIIAFAEKRHICHTRVWMKGWGILILCVVFVVAFFVILTIYHVLNRPPSYFVAGGRRFAFTAFATTAAQRDAGLMNDTNITNSTLMLFVFPQETTDDSFWMYNTYLPLDIIWIQNDTIVHIVNATPCVGVSPLKCAIYNPDDAADFVIEARSGFVERNKITIGERVLLSKD